MIEIISGIYLTGAVLSAWILLYSLKQDSKKYVMPIQKRKILMASIVAFVYSWVGVFVLWKQKRK